MRGLFGVLGMGGIWVKICGITRREDARAAIDLGADALGLVCYPPSSRHVEPGRLREIAAEFCGEAEFHAVFCDPLPREVDAVIGSGVVSSLQFHGAESAGFCKAFGLAYTKALGVREHGEPKDWQRLLPLLEKFGSARKILLDTHDERLAGGTGRSFPWEIAQRLVEAGVDNLVLAGGLCAGNVAEAIRQVRPHGVDVSSGVEAGPGVKDAAKLREFIREASDA